jgi:hypothetical protein
MPIALDPTAVPPPPPPPPRLPDYIGESDTVAAHIDYSAKRAKYTNPEWLEHHFLVYFHET